MRWHQVPWAGSADASHSPCHATLHETGNTTMQNRTRQTHHDTTLREEKEKEKKKRNNRIIETQPSMFSRPFYPRPQSTFSHSSTPASRTRPKSHRIPVSPKRVTVIHDMYRYVLTRSTQTPNRRALWAYLHTTWGRLSQRPPTRHSVFCIKSSWSL